MQRSAEYLALSWSAQESRTWFTVGVIGAGAVESLLLPAALQRVVMQGLQADIWVGTAEGMWALTLANVHSTFVTGVSGLMRITVAAKTKRKERAIPRPFKIKHSLS